MGSGDILQVLKFFRVEDEALDSGDSFNDSPALTALTAFSHVDKHYMCTLPQEPDQEVDQKSGENESMCDVNSDRGSECEGSSDRNPETMPSLVQIS